METEKEVVPIQGLKSEQAIKQEKDFLDVLRMFAPGTAIRVALDDLLRARMGALIVFDSDILKEIVEEGFAINFKFTPQRLVELAKMDGAIVLSSDGKKIIHANSLLFPNVEIPTNETGTRHKAAHRTALHANTITIAVSERKNKISVYYKDEKHALQESSEILRRAAETLQILEKQREAFNELIVNLNMLEVANLVTVHDICSVLQRLEIIKRVADRVKRYLVELGKEGYIVNVRLRELTLGLSQKEDFLFKDYIEGSPSQAKAELEKMDFDLLLEPFSLSKMFFDEIEVEKISPRGIRLLNKTSLLDRHIDSLVSRFGSLDKILFASRDNLREVFETDELVSFFKAEIDALKENIMVGKNI